ASDRKAYSRFSAHPMRRQGAGAAGCARWNARCSIRSVALLGLRRGLDGFHLLVREAEMMAQFVDQHMGDDLAQRVVVVLGPVVENGAAIEEDGVGQL